MFNKKYKITLCANKNDVVKKLGAMDCLGKYTVDIEVKNSVGHVYTKDNLVFYGFTSKLPVHKVANMLKANMNNTSVYVVGGIVFIEFES